MNLDDLDHFRELDTQNMLVHIEGMADQLETAWAEVGALPLAETIRQKQHVLILAGGTAALAAELVMAAYPDRHLPVTVSRDIDPLPAWIKQTDTLLITREMGKAGRTLMVDGLQWPLPNPDMPERAGLPTYVAWFLYILERAGAITGAADQVRDAAETLRRRQEIFGVQSIVVKNPAKRLGGQMVGRIPVIYGGGALAPVARRWKTQINENAKSWSQCEALPDALYNDAAGVLHPPPLMTRVHCTFLVPAPFEPPALLDSLNAVHDLYLQQGIAVDKVKGRGDNRLTQAMSLVQYGDYVSYYLAMAYGVDPTPTPQSL